MLWGKTSQVKRFHFREDWELARRGQLLSCHMALDLLCKEMHEAWLGCCYQEACCHCKECFLSPWTGYYSKGEGCGERMNRRNVPAESFRVRWLAGFLPILIQFKHGVPLERGCPFVSFVLPCCANSLKA